MGHARCVVRKELPLAIQIERRGRVRDLKGVQGSTGMSYHDGDHEFPKHIYE